MHDAPVIRKILFVGAGAIGASVAAWLASHHDGVCVLDVGDVQAALRAGGICTYQTDAPGTTRHTVRVRVVERLSDVPDVDLVVLSVKNYSLPAVARQVRDQLGDRPVIVSMANGVDNQAILPTFFSKVIYCVVGYNAKRESPLTDAVVVGYQKRGPLLIGTPDNSLQAELRAVRDVLALGCPTEVVQHLDDAVHTKIVMNLTNALDALVGHGVVPLSNFDAYQRLLSNTLWEGVRIVRAAGHREHRIAGMPSFLMLRLATLMPRWIARPIFQRKLRAMVMSSMTQDVSLRGAHDTELESLTGYITQLARRVGVAAPYNQTIYRLGQERFHPGFQPMSCEDLQAEVDRARLAAR